MLIKCDTSQKQELLSYIGDDFHKCIYLYMNLSRYGCLAENVQAYKCVNEAGDICGVFLQYFDCVHMFSKNEDIGDDDVNDIVSALSPKVMFMSPEIKAKLAENTVAPYNVFLDTLFEAMHYPIEGEEMKLQEADISEIEEIVAFLMSDAFYSSIYTASSLKEQLLQRMSSGYSRSFISRKNGKILFHMGTTAELDNVVIGGLGLLDDSLRGQGMGKKMFGKFYNLMLSEGKKCYCFPADERADHLHRALGFKVRYTPVKLVKR